MEQSTDLVAEPMKAVVLIWTADERAFGEPFDGPNCLNHAHALADDLRERNDFPGALIVVTGNAAATEDRKERIMASLRPQRSRDGENRE